MINILHIGTCNSEYFAGHHLPWFNIAIDNTTTYADVKESMLEMDTCIDHLDLWDNPNFTEEGYKQAIEVCFEDVKDMNSEVEPNLEMIDIDTWDYYVYFVIEGLGEDDV